MLCCVALCYFALYFIVFTTTSHDYHKTFNTFQNVMLLLEDNIKMSNDSIFHCTFCVKEISGLEMLEFIFEKYKESQDNDLHLFFESENKQKRTPLQEAAFAGRTDILEVLNKNGAFASI